MLTVTTFYLTPERKSRNKKFIWTIQIRGSRPYPFWFPTAPRLLLASSNIPLSALILSHSRLTYPKSTQQRKSSIRNTLTRIKSHVYLRHVASRYFNSPKLGIDSLRIDYNPQKQIFLRTDFVSKRGLEPIT